MTQIDMPPTKDDQMNKEKKRTRSTYSQPAEPESQPSEVTITGEEPDTDSDQEQKALPPALPPASHEHREVQVTEQPNRAVAETKPPKKTDTQVATGLRSQCRQLCADLFFREQSPVQSLGFTSAVGGEGKTFLARMTAMTAAHDSAAPTTLLECNWDHPALHEEFGIPAQPGLAEWLRGECSEQEMRSQVSENLFVIPAGNAKEDPVKLLRQLQRGGLRHLRIAEDELMIVDLPPLLTTGYGVLAASLVEAIMVVVRAGVTPNEFVKTTCDHLKDLPVEGLILNQRKSRIPHWIRQLL